jgi:hypothetical protein
MSVTLVPPPPWPMEPASSSDAASRMAWYAAVARLAPSKHNTQPWRFVIQDSSLEVWTDPRRMLPETDPHHREMIISCGVALHLACVSARALGHRPAVTMLPDGVGGCLARLVEAGSREVTPHDRDLLAAIATRRTDRGPLDADALPDGLPFLLQTAAAEEGASLRLVSTPGDRSTLAGLVERADRLLVKRGRADEELAGWLRASGDPRKDGVPTDHTRGAEASYRAEFVQRDFSTQGSQPAHDRAGIDRPLLGVLCTSSDREVDWLVAGRALGAVLLCAATAGANASYLNQPIEESATRVEMRSALGLAGPAQIVLRLGLGGKVEATRRRDPYRVIFHHPGNCSGPSRRGSLILA